MLEMPTLRRNVSVSTLEAMDQSSMKWDSLQEYVEKHGGSRVISRILIANNGIAAVKCMQSMRRWEYGELGLKNSLSFICMATPEDIKANAEFVRMADEVVEVPGGSNNNNYANVDLIVDIAQRKNVDAVWAGWGHASENPNLPNKLARDQKRNIVFLGPGGTAMNALGDKVGSSIIAQSAGVPCIEWSGSDVNIGEQIAAGSTEIPRETYLKACVTTVEEAVAKSAHVGFPLMVKASEGGGGKGIRKVMHVGELPDAFLQVKAEVVGSPIFLMRLFAGGRHIEVQVLADLHGNVVTLNGRDCSIQRRHQKIIEEGPPVAADPIAFARMEKAAASLAQAVGYAGVGTVEYLYRDGEFYFLEMNPRLQVEHTVTELINDINLPLAMLLVGMGIPMHRIPDIRTLWGMPDRHGSMVIDFDIQLRNPPKCHTIAARITAENPDTGFRPTSGVLQEINFRVSPQVWGYFSVSGRGAVHEFADSQFGHIFSVGSTRESARKHLILALRDLTIYGAIRTTTQYLIAMLELDDYKHNKIDTQWLDGLIANKTIQSRLPEGEAKYLTVVLGAVVKVNASITQLRTEAVTALEYGRVPYDALLCTTFPVELILDGIKYVMTVRVTGEHDFAVELNGSVINTKTHPLSDGRLLVFANGKTSTVFWEEDSTGLRLEIGNKGYTTVVFEKENDPTKLRATTTGKLVRFLVADGERVGAGEPFCEMEVMKMYMQLTTSHAGVLKHAANADSYVKAGDVIGHLDLDDKSSVSTTELYTGKLPPFKPPHMLGTRCHHHLREALHRAGAVMAGFSDPEPDGESIISQILSAVLDRGLPYYEIKEAFVAVAATLPTNVGEAIEDILAKELNQPLESPSAGPLSAAMEPPAMLAGAGGVAAGADGADQESQHRTISSVQKMLAILETHSGDSRISSLRSVLHRHANGRGALLWSTVQPLLTEYMRVEGKFSGMLSMHEQVVMDMVREAVAAETDTPGLTVREQRTLACEKVFKALVSHERVKQKSKLITDILETLAKSMDFLHCFPSTLSVGVKALGEADGDRKSPLLSAATRLGSSEVLAQQHEVMRILRAMEDLRGVFYSKVALEARQLGMRIVTPSIESRKATIYTVLIDVVDKWSKSNETETVKGYRSFGHHLAPLVQSVVSLFEELSSFVAPNYPREVRFAAMELFIRRSFRQYTIASLAIGEDESACCAELWFQRQPRNSRSSDTCILASQASDDDLLLERRHSPMAGGCGGGGRSRRLRSGTPRFPTGNFTDSITDMQQVVNEWEGMMEPEYPRRYSLYALFYSVEALEAKFFDVLKGKFRPDECSQEGLNPSQSPANSRKNSASIMSDDCSSSSEASQQYRNISPDEPVHALNVLVWMGNNEQHQPALDKCADLVQKHRVLLRELKIARVTLVILQEQGYPAFHTFRDRDDFKEDLIYRHLNPPRAFMIEIGRLGVNYDIQPVVGLSKNRHIRTYFATQKPIKGKKTPTDLQRFFVRALVLGRVLTDREDSIHFITRDFDTLLQECCESLGLSKGFTEEKTGKEVGMNRFGTLQMCNHLFLAVLPHLHLNRNEAVELLQDVVTRNNRRLRQVGVTEVEIPLTLIETQAMGGGTNPDDKSAASTPTPEEEQRSQPVRIRVVCSNPSGHKTRINAYVEIFSSSTNMMRSNYVFKSIPLEGLLSPGPLEGKELSTPYPPVDQLELRRLMAKSKDTTFCYDFLTLFEEALRSSWASYAATEQDAASVPRTAAGVSKWIASKVAGSFTSLNSKQQERQRLHSIEMMLDPAGDGLIEVTRPPGQNDVAMVAWKLTMSTPEYPDGREIMLLINDVTVQNGSFGVREDELFALATEFAQSRGIPRIFVAANTGARIGLVDEVRNKFRVQWKNSLNPASGMEFLYLDEDTVDILNRTQMAHTQETTASDGSKRQRISSVIGPDGIGVENLRGSGRIAGVTCRAYNDIFTLTFVSGTAVGIGAYLVRLGQRVIQKGPPILLTGEAALNKVLGKKVYSSNYQLGGTQIMYNNGISHEIVENDLMGVVSILRWLSYVPVRRGAAPALLMSPSNPKQMIDVLDRKVFDPRRGPDPSKIYDPRILLTGSTDAIGKWRGGLFDRDSFCETMGGWGKTTICGRARLGGMAVGVVMPELRSVQCIHPADPADPESKEQVSSQAGQVWFPDSAYKTAQAIGDMNNEGLPLIILANWRGFSGGMRDMYEAILKFGSMIVEKLVGYKQPVLVYVPPGGELRGGAWVVIDPTINKDQMEMFVDPSARGGILEPAGIVEIKYRRAQILATMSRLDPEIAALNLQLASASDEEGRRLAGLLKQRQELLMPHYLKVAEHYADLHDVPARMLAKVSAHVKVVQTRARFYDQHELAEMDAQGGADDGAGDTPEDQDKRMTATYERDLKIAEWLEASSDPKTGHEHPLSQLISQQAKKHIASSVSQLVERDDDAALEGMIAALQQLAPEKRRAMLDKLLA